MLRNRARKWLLFGSCVLAVGACGGQVGEQPSNQEVGNQPDAAEVSDAQTEASARDATPPPPVDPNLTPLFECTQGTASVFLFLKGRPEITLLPSLTYATRTQVDISHVDMKGDSWKIVVSTEKMGRSLMPGLYGNALEYPAETDGHAGFLLSGKGLQCHSIDEPRFRIDRIEFVKRNGNDELDAIIVDFDFRCDGTPVRGCYRSAPPK